MGKWAGTPAASPHCHQPLALGLPPGTAARHEVTPAWGPWSAPGTAVGTGVGRHMGRAGAAAQTLGVPGHHLPREAGPSRAGTGDGDPHTLPLASTESPLPGVALAAQGWEQSQPNPARGGPALPPQHTDVAFLPTRLPKIGTPNLFLNLCHFSPLSTSQPSKSSAIVPPPGGSRHPEGQIQLPRGIPGDLTLGVRALGCTPMCMGTPPAMGRDDWRQPAQCTAGEAFWVAPL